MIRRGFLMSFFKGSSLYNPRKPGIAGSYIGKSTRSLPQTFLRGRVRLMPNASSLPKCHSVPSPTRIRIGRSDPGCKKRLIPSSNAIIRTVGAFGIEACPEYELSRLVPRQAFFRCLCVLPLLMLSPFARIVLQARSYFPRHLPLELGNGFVFVLQTA